MSRIRILPEILSNQIAAGEVVERPASVVKELVENALDAGATRIHVAVEKGGRGLVEVIDNGSGMSHDDALMAIERYATSKLRQAADLFAIRTLGFRGEALPSIAAVSRLTLSTRESEAEAGTELFIEGGSLRQVREVGIPPGTRVAVGQLFFNTPARRKFLKTVATEMSHVGDVLASIALAHPAAAVRLDHDGRMLRQWPAVSEPVVRAADVLGRSLQDLLLPVRHEGETIAVSGWVAPPVETRTSGRSIYLFVNGRWVRDRTLQHALFAGFGQRLMKGQFPVAVLFVRVPFDQVDVNVHPTKHEVRLAEARSVHDAVAMAVSRALSAGEKRHWQSAATQPEPSRVAETPPSFSASAPEPLTAGMPLGKVFPPWPSGAKGDAAEGKGETVSPAPRPAAPAPQAALWPADRFSALEPIGQLHGTYLLCRSETGLVIIDQHAAHERVYYEALRRRLAEHGPAPAQVLLVPETVELGFREAEALERLASGLAACGLEIEPFGGTTFVVKTIPSFVSGGRLAKLLRAIAEDAVETGFGEGLAAALDSSLKLVACHGAIRGHQRLSEAEIKALLQQLDACENPSFCPHGRPTWIQFSLRELEKRFGRIVG
jgi:DNA mismatch repair protein MutL